MTYGANVSHLVNVTLGMVNKNHGVSVNIGVNKALSVNVTQGVNKTHSVNILGTNYLWDY